MNYGLYLRQERMKQNLSVEELAHKSGFTAQAIWNWEHNNCVPTIEEWEQTLKVLEKEIVIVDRQKTWMTESFINDVEVYAEEMQYELGYISIPTEDGALITYHWFNSDDFPGRLADLGEVTPETVRQAMEDCTTIVCMPEREERT